MNQKEGKPDEGIFIGAHVPERLQMNWLQISHKNLETKNRIIIFIHLEKNQAMNRR